MKATLHFNLDDYEEREKHARMLSADKMLSALNEMAEKLHTMLEYNDYSKEQFEIVEKFQEEFYEILSEGGIEL
jgi:metal-dependent HD superfamily phosphatase/phosphodiesterase